MMISRIVRSLGLLFAVATLVATLGSCNSDDQDTSEISTQSDSTASAAPAQSDDPAPADDAGDPAPADGAGDAAPADDAGDPAPADGADDADESAVSDDDGETDDDHSHDDGDDDDDHSHDDGDDDDGDHSHNDGHDDGQTAIDLFLDGALTDEPTIAECTLSDGSISECYTITVVGTPVNHDVGPFCPTSIADDADAGGLWLDGEGSYVIDGPFFTELAGIYGDELWNNIFNDDGSVNVIDNAADFQVAARPDITEEFYYHCVDGDVAWLDSGVQPTSTIQVPATPVLTDAVTVEFASGAHSTLGVTFNGAGLSGSADMAAILSSYTIAAFDDCGGHINPALGYHVHGTAGCSDVGEASAGETAPFAIAIDGHTIHGPLEDSTVVLDECNGHTTDEYGYHYHANSIEENATLTCVKGLTLEGAGQLGGPGRGERPEPPDGQAGGERPEPPAGE